MQMQSRSWEGMLLSRASEAWGSRVEAGARVGDAALLARAYQHCTDLTSIHSRSFFLASSLLPAEQRKGIRALYAFCRISDDIVDGDGDNRRAALQIWRGHTLSASPPHDDLVAVAWADTRSRYGVPERYAEQLLDGVAADLSKDRYASFEELAGYSYGVASTVGLMAMHIVGYRSSEAIPYAIKLGVALQMTNILRDVAEDWRRGRIYLPQDELAAYGLQEADLDAGVVTERWRTFMRFQIARTRRLYAEARPGVAYLERSGRLAIMAAADLYAAILEDIERHDYDVFSRRAYVSTAGKVRRLPRIWWRTQMV